MSDLALVWSNARCAADLALTVFDLSTDAGLETAVLISLFSDQRARDDDSLLAVTPARETPDRRGWWGDAYADVAGDLLGSRLWLLTREKRLPEVLNKAREYATEALAWLIEDKIASAVQVRAEWFGDSGIGLEIQITRPGLPAARFYYVWDATEAHIASLPPEVFGAAETVGEPGVLDFNYGVSLIPFLI